VAHRLIDVITPDMPFTAGEYSRQARAALQDITAGKRLPIVSGGTGLYLRALTEGLFAGPERQNDLRSRLARSRTRHGGAWLHRLLKRLDPQSAARIHANDAAKLMRAIEVCVASRRPLSALLESQTEARDPLTGFRLLRIGLNPPPAGTLWPGEGTGFARLSPGARGARSKHERTSRSRGCTAGAQELCQAPADVVSPRAGRALAGNVWRRRAGVAGGSGTTRDSWLEISDPFALRLGSRLRLDSRPESETFPQAALRASGSRGRQCPPLPAGRNDEPAE
jgi:IPP transferase